MTGRLFFLNFSSKQKEFNMRSPQNGAGQLETRPRIPFSAINLEAKAALARLPAEGSVARDRSGSQ